MNTTMIFDCNKNGELLKIDNTRHILFGLGGVVAAIRKEKEDEFTKLAMWELEKPVGTGEEVNESNNDVKNDMAGLVMAFKSVESIDVVIGWLEDTKRAMLGEKLENSRNVEVE